jgi:hypothetical protein
MANFKKLYNEKLKGRIQKELGFENVMEIGRGFTEWEID